MIEQKLVTMTVGTHKIEERAELQPYLNDGWTIGSVTVAGAGRHYSFAILIAVVLERTL